MSDGGATRSFAYDDAGNFTADSGGAVNRDLAYNHAGRLVEAQAGETRLYTYDALGQRRIKAPPGQGRNPPPPAQVTHYHYYRDSNLLAETDGTGATLREYIHLAGLPLALIVPAGPELHTVHPDHLGTPQKMTDAAGALTWDAQFRPFGEPHAIAGTADNDQRFPGQLLDPETDLHYNYLRDYDPTLGRYIESDPIGLAGGLNTYAYVDGNPISHADRDGLVVETPWDLLNVALGGASLGYNLDQGNYSDAFLDALGLAYDLSATCIPFLPAGAGVLKNVTKAPLARGREAQARVLNELGLSKNTQKVSTAEGNAIPDALTSTRSVEIKDTLCVSCTKQIRIQTDAARKAGRESVLITGSKTRVYGPAKKAFDRITRRSDLGPQ